jgi:molybdopterin molybdotransferase
MISVSDAQQIILEHSRPGAPETVPLTSAALGRVLAEDITSDIDMPQCDKSMMDGFAVRSADVSAGQTALAVIEEVTAGRLPQRTVGAGQAIRIMTGAPMPAGADAVVPVERTRMLDDQRVQIEERSWSAGKNVLPRAKEMRRGETVLKKGMVLRPQVLGVLATVGRTSAAVHPAPAVAIIPTGDEIVEVSQTPGPQQVRNSNAALLAGQIARGGGVPRYLGIARDTVESLQTLIREGLKSPVLVLSGGVSAGKLDLVPGVLQELGVQAHFHKVAMKPGKPIFFGTCADGSSCLVFGLPGNPVSSLACFELFVRPAIRRVLGHADPGTLPVPLPLAEDFNYKTDRPTYHPARVEASSEGWRVRVVPWFGSADLRALADADALVLFPVGEHRHRAGQLFPVLRMD